MSIFLAAEMPRLQKLLQVHTARRTTTRVAKKAKARLGSALGENDSDMNCTDRKALLLRLLARRNAGRANP